MLFELLLQPMPPGDHETLVPDGRTILSIDQAATISGLPPALMRREWLAFWGELMPDAVIDAILKFEGMPPRVKSEPTLKERRRAAAGTIREASARRARVDAAAAKRPRGKGAR